MLKVVKFVAANLLAFSSLFFAAPSFADEPAITVVNTPGGDDSSYQIPLTVAVTFDGVQYESVYATTNSVITFGRPDGTYWTYPQTPSISLYSMDWVVYPQWRADEHLTISASDGGFQVDISARPIWLQNTPEVTNINIVAAINADGTVAISYAVTGPTYDNQTRTGVRLTNGDVVSLEAYGVVEVVTPPVLTPEPVEPTPEPSPSVGPTPEPTPVVTPPVIVPQPAPQPAPEPVPEPAPPIEEPPVPTPEASPEPMPEAPEPPAPAPEPPVEVFEPPVVIEPVVEPPVAVDTPAMLAAAAEADDPEVPQELAAIPLLGDAAVAVLEAFNALGNVGADLDPQVRETAQETIVASVIVSNIASTSVMASAASYRRMK